MKKTMTKKSMPMKKMAKDKMADKEIDMPSAKDKSKSKAKPMDRKKEIMDNMDY